MANPPPPHWIIGVESRLLDRVRAGVLVTSLDGTVLYANPYCAVLYGRTPDELEGRASADFAAEPLDPSAVSEIGRALTSGKSWEGDFRVVRKDGSIVTVHAVNSPLFAESGAVTGVVCIAFDVTSRRLSEQQLSEREATQRFLAERSTMLASSLAFPESFEHLAQLSVPFLGDLCIIDVADGIAMRRVAAVHADASRQELVDRLEQRLPDATEAHRTPDDLFGEERLGAIIAANVLGSADEIADRILTAVIAFGPPEPRDDVAILVVKVDAELSRV